MSLEKCRCLRYFIVSHYCTKENSLSMEKIILSMKNLYKLLMNNDFPIYSESVISERNRKGQTLMRFWQNILSDSFRSRPYGRKIWRNDGKRNRYVSSICNRSEDTRFCEGYAKELAAAVTQESLLSQIGRFSDFLRNWDYRHDVLIRRIQEMMRLLDTEDPTVPKAVLHHILNNYDHVLYR